MRFAVDETDPLERRNLTGDPGRRDPEPVCELGAAQLPVGCPAQLAQDREIRE